MSFLFFGIRPLYIFIENDWDLFTNVYYLTVTTNDVSEAMFWASLGLWIFSLAAFFTPRTFSRYIFIRTVNNKSINEEQTCSGKNAVFLIGLQLITIPIMYVFSGFGRQLYQSALGAYVYDFPMLLQSVNIFSLVFLFKRLVRARTTSNLIFFIFSAILFLQVSWLMRDLSLFRGFYLSGVLIAGIAILQLMRRQSTFILLLVGVLALQPIFKILGEDRSLNNSEITNINVLERAFGEKSLGELYWSFYDSKGDMNIFDTFLAAKKYEPIYRPYLWSWIYVPFHLVPRALWAEKPISGITQDVSFTNGAPTSPGILGFFLLDGGLVWMLCSMAFLGFLISMLDEYILSMPPGNLQAIFIGIITINSMFLSRFFLWQYFYQMLYSFLTVTILSRWLARREYIFKLAKHRQILLNEKIRNLSIDKFPR